MPTGGTFLDIGSHIGWYSFLFAFFNYSVIAVEAMPSNQRAFEHTACANPTLAKRITLVRSALVAPDTPRPCFTKQPLGSNNTGNGVLACGSEAATQCATGAFRCEQVRTQTLNQLLKQLGETVTKDIVAVKMDTEGAECDIMRGGQTLFEIRPPPLIQLEGGNKAIASCVIEQAGDHALALGSGRGHDKNLVLIDPQRMVSADRSRAACPRGCRAYHLDGWKPHCRFGPPGHRCWLRPRGGSEQKPARLLGAPPSNSCDAAALFRDVIDGP